MKKIMLRIFGISLLNDKSINGRLRINAVGLNMAYNSDLDRTGQQSIGVGFRGMLLSRKIDYSRLSFENQFTSGGLIPWRLSAKHYRNI